MQDSSPPIIDASQAHSKEVKSANTASEASSPSEQETCYDIVMIGFGPASLSLAIALLELPQSTPPKVLIIERKPSFSWLGEGTPLGTSHMRTNLLQDLVTARNPKSDYSFVNWLWSTNNLVGYTNLGSTHPPRELFDMYLQSCAKHIDKQGWTRYGHKATAIAPHKLTSSDSNDSFVVHMRDLQSGCSKSVVGKKIIVAPGRSRSIHPALADASLDESTFHVQDSTRVEKALARISTDRVARVAIVGSDDDAVEAAEHYLAAARPAEVTLLVEADTLRQPDTNSFAKDAVLASRLAAFETVGRSHEQIGIRPSVQSSALDELYERQYMQDVRRMAGRRPRINVQQFCRIVRAEKIAGSKQISIQVESTLDCCQIPMKPFDVVLSAIPDTRAIHGELLQPLKDLSDNQELSQKKASFTLDAAYRLGLRRDRVDSKAGVWVIDGYEGGALDAFEFMALRTERILQSLRAADKTSEKPASSATEKHAESRASL